MISAQQIYDFINGFAPFDTAMSFDNVGILIGSGSEVSERVILALDLTRGVIDEAVKKNAGIIITHHPVIFSPLRHLDTESIPYLAAKNGITVISAHTNLDIAAGGVNDTLAAAAGVETEERFPDDCALTGRLSGPLTCAELASSLCKRLSLAGLRYTDNGRKIERAVVSCGAGGEGVIIAKEKGADAIITGEIKHHLIEFANDNGIAVFDLGHFGSEKLIIPVLTEKLRAAFPSCEFIHSENDTDGIQYFTSCNT